MNDLTTNASANALARYAGYEDLDDSLTIMQQNMPARSFDPYLRMGKDGKWIFGAENVEVEPGSRWAVDPLLIEHGYVCWTRYPEGDKRPPEKKGEIMVPHNRPLPDRATLTDHGFPWADQIGFKVVCVSGEDTGTQTQYSTTSLGGLDAIRKQLIPAVVQQIAKEKQKGPIGPQSKVVAVMELRSTFYVHPRYGKTYTPIFNIVDWAEAGASSYTPGNGGEPQQAAPTVAPDEPRRRRTRV